MAISYRPDIDGLRAIAVSAVVTFHVGVPGFGGGFVGVDVFFVISGFLITTLLLEELRRSGSINLLAFYARRARRLLPAFFLVVAVTLLLGAWILLPVGGEQHDLAKSARAAALYFSNLYFAGTTRGYFDNSSELLPLLHTWSLAVEEQFYVIWPPCLIAFAWIAKRRQWPTAMCIAGGLLVIFAASLAYSHLMANAGGKAVQVAFFALSSRAWELAIGAALAMGLPYLKVSIRWFGSALAAIGLFAITAAIMLFQEDMPFPGVPALLPTLGAAAIIAGGQLAPQSWVPQLLSTRLFVGIGLLSYSWYLWHWPLLAIARARELGVANVGRDGAIALGALGLAWLTYALIEHPIRSRKMWGDWSKARILAAGAAASLVLIAGAVGLQLRSDQLARSERYERVAQAADDKTWKKPHCHHNNGRCAQSAGVEYRGLVVLWGDSHADHFAGTVHTAVAPHGLALLARDMGGCPPIINTVVYAGAKPWEECARFNTKVLAEIDNLSRRKELTGVVLAARWPLYLGGPKPSGKPSPRILALPGQSPSVDAAPNALYRGLKATITTLLERGIKVLVIAPAPEFRYNIPKCLARKSTGVCDLTREEAENHRRYALTELRTVARDEPDIRLWDPFTALCGKECLVERDGLILYHDDGHLTYRASLWLAPYFDDMAFWLGSRINVSSSRLEDASLEK